MLPGFGFDGSRPTEVAQPVVVGSPVARPARRGGHDRPPLPDLLALRTPLVFRVVDDWFIAADEVRQPMLEANATVEWTPDFYSKRMDDWLRNMGDWNISRQALLRAAAAVLPCSCGHLTVIGSSAELEERAVRGLEQLQELHRPWIDEVIIRCEACDEEVQRIPEVGDAWLDAGSSPVDARLAERAKRTRRERHRCGEGLTIADLPDHAYWEEVVPGRLGLRDARADPALVLLDLVHVGDARRPLAVRARAHVREAARRDRPRDASLVGERDRGAGGARAHGRRRHALAVLLAAAEPEPPVRLRPAHEIQRKLLTLWNSCKFLVDYANIDRLDAPGGTISRTGPAATSSRSTAGSSSGRTALVAEATEAYERWLTVDVVRAYESFVDDVSNWYIRRSRRRFWDGEPVALRTLWYALVQGLRVVAPLMPFLTDHLWRVLTAPCEGAPSSVHLAGWPETVAPDADLLAEIAELRRVVELGRQARATSGLKLRQPLRALVVEGAPLAEGHAAEIADELRVRGCRSATSRRASCA